MRRRLCLSLLVIILLISSLCFPSISSAASEDETIRVKLSVSGSSISITLNGRYTPSNSSKTILEKGSYTVSISNGQLLLKGNGVSLSCGSSFTLSRYQYSGDTSHTMTIKGTDYGTVNYLGDMVFSISSSKITVINHVPLEEYLYGVVAYEMSNSFPVEALKAQAVCARGYAVKAISSSGSYDIGDTSADQVYKGFNASYTNVIRAVNETKGQVLTYDGKICTTYYSASNGGQTELPGNAWGGGDSKNKTYPYLAQKDDPYDTENPSSLTQTIFVPKKVEGSDYDAVASSSSYVVRIVNCNVSCNVRSGPGTQYELLGQAPVNSVYEWVSTTGDWHEVIYNGKSAYIINDYAQKVKSGNYLYSNAVLDDLQQQAFEALTDSGVDINADTDVKLITVNQLKNGTERWPGTGSRNYVDADANITVKYLTAGSSKLSSAKTLNVTITLMEKSSSGSYLLSHPYLNSNLRMRGVESATNGFNVTCVRYGHGVGMSQRGAQTMAQEHGKTYKDILTFYFDGTKISSLDSSGTPDPDPDPGANPTLSSSKYKIASSQITGLSEQLSVKTFLSGFTVKNGSISLTTSAGKAKTSGYVGTGDILLLKTTAGKTYKKYTLVLYGDTNGDGSISILDLLRTQKHLLGSSKLSAPYSTAADVSKDGEVSILDLLRIQKHLLDVTTITQK